MGKIFSLRKAEPEKLVRVNRCFFFFTLYTFGGIEETNLSLDLILMKAKIWWLGFNFGNEGRIVGKRWPKKNPILVLFVCSYAVATGLWSADPRGLCVFHRKTPLGINPCTVFVHNMRGT